MIEYHIQPQAPHAHLFRVELTIPEPHPDGQVLSMPAWIPGSYMIRDFARQVVTLRAQCDDADVPVRKLDKQTWRCSAHAGPVRVTYEIYAHELSVRAAYLDGTRGYFNGTSVFLGVRGHEESPCRVRIGRPEGSAYRHWELATSMEPEVVEAGGFGSYRAADYQDLIDHPVEMGRLARTRFSVRGVPHELIISGRHRCDLSRLSRDLPRICETHVSLFGELPLQRYLFLVLAVGEGYGGLEHRASSSLICSRDDLPRSGEEDLGEGYRRFLGLCSHEFFHLWNVKRIRPRVFVENGLDREVHTRLLWVFEGITSYYDDLALVRSGLITEASYLELLARNITRLLRGKGRFKQTLEESSFDAWTKFYKQDENAPNGIVSYYTKGALVALALDLTIRLGTEGSKSLDDLMRALWERFGKTGRGVGEDEVEALAAQVTGLELGEFFDLSLRSTRDLELEGLLEQFAVSMRLRPARDQDDQGGLIGDKAVAEQEPPRVLGVRYGRNGQASTLTHVLEGGAAQAAGLAAGDEVVALNGIRIRPDNLDKLVGQVRPGESASVHVFRRDELMELVVTPQPGGADTCDLALLEDAPERARRLRRDWLGQGQA
jgi:predicted metalloprotease with PDZ domain